MDLRIGQLAGRVVRVVRCDFYVYSALRLLPDTRGKWRAGCEGPRLAAQATESSSVAVRRERRACRRGLEVTTVVAARGIAPRPLPSSALEQHHMRDREVTGVRQRDDRASAAHLGEARRRTGMKLQRRRAMMPDHLDRRPIHATRESRAQRLHRRLFCGESRRERRGRAALLGAAIGDFAFSEDAADEVIAVALDRLGYP